MTPKKMAAMLKQQASSQSSENEAHPEQKAFLAYNDTGLGGKGFLNWTAFKHPDLGEIEIGGEVPFASNTPHAGEIESLFEKQIPWILELAKKTALISISKTEAESLGNGVFKIKTWVENTGYLPYPISMGQRNNRILPVILRLEGKDLALLDGKPRMKITSLAGRQIRKIEWLVQTGSPDTVTVYAETENAGQDSAEISLGGSK